MNSVYTCVCVYSSVCVCVCVYTCVCVFKCVCTHVCMCVRCVRTRVWRLQGCNGHRGCTEIVPATLRLWGKKAAVKFLCYMLHSSSGLLGWTRTDLH